jgi:hypothetical protein
MLQRIAEKSPKRERDGGTDLGQVPGFSKSIIYNRLTRSSARARPAKHPAKQTPLFASTTGSAVLRDLPPSGISRENGGAEGIRTLDLLDAIEARSQLRHGPTGKKNGYAFIAPGGGKRQTAGAV